MNQKFKPLIKASIFFIPRAVIVLICYFFNLKFCGRFNSVACVGGGFLIALFLLI
jgi:hypothetical protein